jgi:PST family polysaccharide transporter
VTDRPAGDTGTASLDEPNLTQAAVGGAAWQGGAYIGARVLVLISTVVLSRVLSVSEFGLVALALVFLNFADVLSDFGITQAVIYLPLDRRRNDTALVASVTSAVLLMVCVALAAPLIGNLLDTEGVTPLLRVLSLSLVINAIGAVPDAILCKDLRFKQRVMSDVARGAVRGGVAIALAFAGWGAWAIVAGQIAGEAVYSAVLWSKVSYRPRLRDLRIERVHLTPLLRFGGPIAAAGLLSTLVLNVDYLIVGSALGDRELGLYTLAFRIPEMIIIAVFRVLSIVSFPVFMRAKDDLGRLRRGYLRAFRLQTAYGLMAGAGIAATAPLIVPTVFGAKWHASIAPLQALALYASLRSLGTGVVDLCKALGRPRLALAFSAARLAVLLPGLALATRFGITAVAWTQAAVALGFVFVMQGAAARLLGLRFADFVTAAVAPLSGGAGVLLGAGLVRVAVSGPDAGVLAVSVIAGAVGGLLGLYAADRSFIRDAVAMVRSSGRGGSTLRA